MTVIVANINKSGTGVKLTGFIRVTANSTLSADGILYVTDPVNYPLVAGAVSFDLEPSDIAQVSYRFEVVSVNQTDLSESVVWAFDAVVPYSAVPLDFTNLAPQSGLRFDRRDASLLTLARYLVSNATFTNYLGNLLWANKGNWVATTVYKRGDVVNRRGSSYQYVSPLQQANLLPEANADTWALLVQGLDRSSAVPAGSMLFHVAGVPVPAGYLACNGTRVSRTTYANLFAALGSPTESGDGVSTFDLPSSPITGAGFYIICTGS